MNQNNTYPQAFTCPISHDLMENPMVDHEGNTYERTYIFQWLNSHNTSPISRNALSVGQLSPNRALKDLIEKYKQENNIAISKINTPDIGRDIDMTDFSLKISTYQKYKLVSINPPSGKDRQPADICAVVDISGSMGSQAKIKNSFGQDESHGLSLLDITKHALKTIVYCLKPDDRFSLVSYSSNARVEYELKYMSLENKQDVLNCIDGLSTEGQTNLWDGLFKGMQELKKNHGAGRNSGVFLLTDGCPNIEPPRGHVPMLKKYQDENSDFKFSIDTYGFGYNLKSDLLNELSMTGNGSYSFIPDSGFVGTVIEHSISNFLVNVSTNSVLSISPNKGSIINSFYPYSKEVTSWGEQINIGPIQYGQPKNIIIEMDSEDSDIDVNVKYFDTRDNTLKELSSTNISTESNDMQVLVHYCRYLFGMEVYRAMIDMNVEIVKSLSSFIKDLPISNNEYIKDLIKDIDGQVSEALSKSEYFNKWGKHYLPSLIASHQLQKCNNFKDHGVQHFGGNLFKKIRDEADDIFCNLEAPKPSVSTYGRQSTYSAPVSMAVYSQASAGCIEGKSLVSMYDGSEKMIEEIKKGDEVLTPNGFKATVRCVVKTLTKDNKEFIVKFDSGLGITMWHPVRIDNKWTFPEDILSSTEVECPAVYSFVLNTEDEHVMIVNGIDCIALGHGINLPVAEHTYYGTDAIINDLTQMNGWDNGLIELNHNCIERDEYTGRVVKLSQ